MGAITESNIDIDFAAAATAPPPELDLRPDRLEFGRVTAPLWFRAWYRKGAWERGRIEPWHTIDLHPAAIVLHYAQCIFEGLKAYKMPDGSVALFRPDMNARRMNHSAARMAMPEIPEQLFLDGIRALVDCQRKWIPNPPGSLYIRPTMIGTEPCIGVRRQQRVFVLRDRAAVGQLFSAGAEREHGHGPRVCLGNRGARRARRNRRRQGGSELFGDAPSDRRGQEEGLRAGDVPGFARRAHSGGDGRHERILPARRHVDYAAVDGHAAGRDHARQHPEAGAHARNQGEGGADRVGGVVGRGEVRAR